jgi:hypothetical protein
MCTEALRRVRELTDEERGAVTEAYRVAGVRDPLTTFGIPAPILTDIYGSGPWSTLIQKVGSGEN